MRPQQHDGDRSVPSFHTSGDGDLQPPGIEQGEPPAIDHHRIDHRCPNGLFDAPSPNRGLTRRTHVKSARGH
jgi:hypothetical protein